MLIYPELLLSLRSEEALLGLLHSAGLFQSLSDFLLLALPLCDLLSLKQFIFKLIFSLRQTSSSSMSDCMPP